MARVLYFVTSYRRPEQVLRLVGTIGQESPGAEILIHHDQFRSRLDAAEVTRVTRRARLLSSPAPLKWGDFSVVDMHWRCFEWALDRVDFDWLIMLSEQDYPVWPLAKTEGLLQDSGSDIFVRAEPVDATDRGPDALSYHRYFFSYAEVPGAAIAQRYPVPWARAWRRWRQRAVNRINRQPGRMIRAETYPDGMPTRFGVRRNTTPFSSSFPCWVGEAWFSLSRPAVAEVVSFSKSHPFYRRYYIRTIVPEESATVSIVLNSPRLRVEARNLHFERWSDRYSGHPDVLRRDDLDEIIGSGMPFARKFDLDTDAGVMGALDAERRLARG